MLLTPERPSRAIILGADIPLAGDGLPVSLVDVDGTSLLECQCDALRSTGISDIVVVCGDDHSSLLSLIAREPGARHVSNPFSQLGGCAGALWFAQDELDGNLVILEGDVIVSLDGIAAMTSGAMPLAIAVSMSRARQNGDMLIEGGLVRSLSQVQGDSHPDARSLGMAALRGPGVERLRATLVSTLEKPDGLTKGLCDIIVDLADTIPVGFVTLEDCDRIETVMSCRGLPSVTSRCLPSSSSSWSESELRMSKLFSSATGASTMKEPPAFPAESRLPLAGRPFGAAQPF
jgi:choline kinase